jgi:hypothetical protein
MNNLVKSHVTVQDVELTFVHKEGVFKVKNGGK